MPANQIQYSERYYDDDIAAQLPKGKLLSEAEWRALGVQQSRGWTMIDSSSSNACQVHYAIHKPEPHIMLFRRPKGYGTEMAVANGTAVAAK
ncbi:hypothetical protein QBZ16_005179 [Prototheca wickerhamii]|uniref:Cyclin-dependent kinases regulatory subunit n=1 Tax=Prototheca wickerhamii TaxID=3111 RepID=A0AAD9MMH5_PROWI|nr:hypothetical protein QBZ16_005179 [Prototheca wickerhamii]